MINLYRIYILVAFSIVFSTISLTQETKISGLVTDRNNLAMLGASITIPDLNLGTVTDKDGTYSLRLTTGGTFIVQCSFIGYSVVSDTIKIEKNKAFILNFKLSQSVNELESIVISSTKQRENTLARINMKSIDQLPNSSGNIETIIKTMSGVVSGNELSSQFSVRGGSYDENLIYVNDIEIYRPFLVQSATQEGLSFVNPNMVSSLQFSAGAFEAEYGDKMASVLDVKYKKPTEFEGTVIASLLGGAIHLAGASKNNQFYANTGFRYKTTNYLLNSLDVKGEYVPRFADLQTLFGYNISSKSTITFLGNYSTNRFSLVPKNRETDFGSLASTKRFIVYYEGQEKDRFDSYMGALSYSYTPTRNLNLKLIASSFDTDEEISYDILSEYWLSEISKGGNNDTTINIGTGSSLKHARNKLNANVYALEHKGLFVRNNFTWKWGLKAQFEYVDDALSEWQMLDSAGMSIPYSDEYIYLDYSYKAHNTIESFRYQAFIQNSHSFYTSNAQINYTIGLRMNYWDFNNELLLSPRATINIIPDWERRMQFYFATGIYNQPPFYKELIDYKGQLYPETKAQKSYHFVLGTDLHYKAWDRPFVFTSEIYYKYYSYLIPYQIENIQINYMPQYKAKGYSRGVDFRLNGEFVPGVESWFSISFLQSREDTYNDSYVKNNGTVIYPGYYRRPSDQTLTFSIFFQDYLPSNPHYKVHLLVNYGTGLPYSGSNHDQPSITYQLSQYRRVDIGFARKINRNKSKNIGLNNIWLTLEILNLLDAPNIASYDWVRTVENNEGYQDNFAVPNYLTGRRINFKISTKL